MLRLRDGGIARRERIPQRSRFALIALRFAQRLFDPRAGGLGGTGPVGHCAVQFTRPALLRLERRSGCRKVDCQRIGARYGGRLGIPRALIGASQRLVFRILTGDALLHRAHAVCQRRQINAGRPGKVRHAGGRVQRQALQHRGAVQRHRIVLDIEIEHDVLQNRQLIGPVEIRLRGMSVFLCHKSLR